MRIKELIAELQSLLEEHGDLEVIRSRDDEGNGFDPVYGIAEGYMSTCWSEFCDGDGTDEGYDLNKMIHSVVIW